MGIIYDTLGAYVALGMFVLCVVFGIALRPLWHQTHVRAWMFSFGVAALGLALFVLPANDGTTGGLALLAFRNGLLLLGSGYQLWGWSRLLGRTWPWPVAWIPMVVLVIGYFAWGSTYPHRVLIVNLAMSLTALAHLGVVHKHVPPAFEQVRGAMRLSLAGHAVFCLARSAKASFKPGPESLFNWTALSFLEFVGFFALLACLEWFWADKWEQGRRREGGHSS